MKLMTLPIAAALTAAALAQGGATTVKGTLMDVACALPMTAKEIADHSRDCMQMDECDKSGYAVMTADGQILRLDANGNAMARAQLKATAQAKDFKVTVTGAVKDGTFAASSVVLDK
jgi:hypothetical protein